MERKIRKIKIHNFVHLDLTITTMYLVLFYHENLPCSTLLNQVYQIVSKMGPNDPLVNVLKFFLETYIPHLCSKSG